MTKYREILRLHSMDLSQTNIAAICGASKKTVNKVLKAAKESGISWPLDDALTDAVLEEKLFPKAPKVSPTKRMPDFDYIRKELMRNGVNKKLLWTAAIFQRPISPPWTNRCPLRLPRPLPEGWRWTARYCSRRS